MERLRRDVGGSRSLVLRIGGFAGLGVPGTVSTCYRPGQARTFGDSSRTSGRAQGFRIDPQQGEARAPAGPRCWSTLLVHTLLVLLVMLVLLVQVAWTPPAALP